MNHFQNTGKLGPLLKIAICLVLLGALVYSGLGLTNLLLEPGEKICLLADADSIDTKKREPDQKDDNLDFKPFGNSIKHEICLADKKTVCSLAVKIYFDYHSTLSRYLLYHRLKIDCKICLA